MTRLSLSAVLILLGSASAAPGLKSVREADGATASNVTLAPVKVSPDGTFKPKLNVSLPYGQTEKSFVNVDLSTSYASVLLESLSSLTSVDCSSDSVSLTFDNAEDLESAYSEWSSHPLLVLVTNHMGNCDTEFERGFFSASSYVSDESTLSLVASARKSNINDIASYLRTNFSGIPTVSVPATPKRGLGEITFDPDPLNFSTGLVLNSTTIYSDDYFVATLDSGFLDLSVTIGGFLVYNVIKSELEELELYLEVNTTSDIVLELDIDVPYNKTFSYEKALDFYAVNIPGVLSFGPDISFSIGAEVDAGAGVGVVLDLSSTITNGTIVLDYTGNLTATGSWEPTVDISVTISEAADLAVRPFVTSLFALEFEILNGAHNASGGIAPQSSFPTTISLAAEQETGGGKNGNATITEAGSAGCEIGVEVVSDFNFALDAFVTGRWNDEYALDVSIPVLDQCFSW